MHEGLDIAGLGEEKVKKNGTRESTVLELFLPATLDPQDQFGLKLDIVDQIWVQVRMGSWGFTLFWVDIFWGTIYFWKHSGSPLLDKCNGRLGRLTIRIYKFFVK